MQESINKTAQVIILLLLSSLVLAAPKTALIIGNSNYVSSPLTNPVNDAADISEKLESLDFEVFHYQDLNRKNMRNSIRKFGEKLKQKKGVGIFFYAGHGMQVNGKNYLIPIAADIQSEFEVPDESVEADLLLRALDDADNPLNIVVLDACRDNPFARSFRSSVKGLARMEGGTGTIIAYSTGPGNVAMDGEGRNSPYTKHLLKHMTQTGLSIEQVFKRVRVGVETDSKGKQTPWETSSLRGDFYFVPKKVQPSTNLQKTTVKLEPMPVVYKEKPQRTTSPPVISSPLVANMKPEKTNKAGLKLTIYTNPDVADVRIHNWQESYRSGMSLPPGDYNVEVSKEGYISKKQWISIDKQDVQLQVTLVPDY